jgi:hypothetical protein
MMTINYGSYSRSSEHFESTQRVAKPIDSKSAEKVSQTKPIVQPQTAKSTAVTKSSHETKAGQNLESKLETIGIDALLFTRNSAKAQLSKSTRTKSLFTSNSLSEKRNSSSPMLS